MQRNFAAIVLALALPLAAAAANCPPAQKFGPGAPSFCQLPIDPNSRPTAPLESWFTRSMFYDLFSKANLGHGPHECLPYSFESFVIAARYFPRFGNPFEGNGGANYSAPVNARRDVAAFFAHAIQETGENDASLYAGRTREEADDCFYRGGLFNWFEGGPVSAFLPAPSHGAQPSDGASCTLAGRYCQQNAELDYFFPCLNETTADGHHRQCYFGRGVIQLSYNFNYELASNTKHNRRLAAGAKSSPNKNRPAARDDGLVVVRRDAASGRHFNCSRVFRFYSTPQPPKPAMHDIVIGNWHAGERNAAAGYSGAIFGPTSLIINNECHGEDAAPIGAGSGGENRRIRAFKWFTRFFGVPAGDDRSLSCKNMPEHFASRSHLLSYQPNWSATWKAGAKCECAPAGYSGMIPFYDPALYSTEWTALNPTLARWCQQTIYDNPSMYNLDNKTSACLNTPL